MIGISLISVFSGWALHELYNLRYLSINSDNHVLKNDRNFIADAAEKVINSVVDIKIESAKYDGLFSSGSGIIIDDQGLILTNAHVVADFVQDGVIKITTSDHEEFNGSCLSMDIESDLALIKVPNTKKWKHATLGSGNGIRVGDWVVAIGSPLGLYNTVTVGIVSSTCRKSHEIGKEESSLEFIQTDCNVHHGNSGGPLINIDGEVIGILTSRADVEGISFAIPMHEAMPIVECMKEGKNLARPVIGAKMVTLNDKTRIQLSQSHMFHPDQKGVLITFVKESSPAHQAGIVTGDIISQIDGQVVATVQDVLRKIGRRMNEEIKMTIIRNIPFEQDWYGRTFTFSTLVKEVCVKTSLVEKIPIGVIGGSGLYHLEGFEVIEEVYPETPWGFPSDHIVICKSPLGHRVAFLARHGRGHYQNPTEVNARANIAALKHLGVEVILSFSAVGSLREEIRPRDFVIPSQLIDRTKGTRPSTFFENGVVGHVGFADPFCPELASMICEQLDTEGITFHQDKTLIVMEGPAFSTRAESHMYRSWGADLINMSALPEAKLAREAETVYQMICMATDYDCWKETEDAVSVQAVIANLSANSGNAQRVLLKILPVLEDAIERGSFEALNAVRGSNMNSIITSKLKRDPDTVAKLSYILPNHFE